MIFYSFWSVKQRIFHHQTSLKMLLKYHLFVNENNRIEIGLNMFLITKITTLFYNYLFRHFLLVFFVFLLQVLACICPFCEAQLEVIAIQQKTAPRIAKRCFLFLASTFSPLGRFEWNSCTHGEWTQLLFQPHRLFDLFAQALSDFATWQIR